MKTGIHPNYQEAVVRCACGNEIATRSTVKEMHVNTCSSCHPFFTGSAKLIDTEGRVDRFKKRFAEGLY
jgi:large subunit ribosomal protein L31